MVMVKQIFDVATHYQLVFMRFVYPTNYTKITDNGWHINFKGSNTNSLTNSSIATGHEADGAKNQQVNFNVAKWVNDNTKFKST